MAVENKVPSTKIKNKSHPTEGRRASPRAFVGRNKREEKRKVSEVSKDKALRRETPRENNDIDRSKSRMRIISYGMIGEETESVRLWQNGTIEYASESANQILERLKQIAKGHKEISRIAKKTRTVLAKLNRSPHGE